MMAAKATNNALQIWKNSAKTGNAYSETRMHPLATLRNRLIDHILNLKKIDESYARWALKNYEMMFPELELIKGVREALRSLGPQA